MITKEMRNDIMYGQNWVEQMRKTRRVIHYVPICDSDSHAPYVMIERLFYAVFAEVPNPELWKRRKMGFRYSSQDFPLIR